MIGELKKQGIWVAGASMHGQYMHKQDLTGPLAIVIGSEGKGLGKLVSEAATPYRYDNHCDYQTYSFTKDFQAIFDQLSS